MTTNEFSTALLRKPLVLLADSQLLFIKENDRPYIHRIHQLFPGRQKLNAAYIGASNGDKHEYFELFEQAMQSVAINKCRHIKVDANSDDLDFLSRADIILLAGGDIHTGWQALTRLCSPVMQARDQGALVIGTSAGAIQMGSLGWHDKAHLSNTDLFSTFGWAPAVFGVHEEKSDWRRLIDVVSKTGGCLKGIGIPSGGGVIVTVDNNVQALRKPLISLTVKDRQIIKQSTWQLQLP